MLAPNLAPHQGPQLDLIVDVITPPMVEISAWGECTKDGHRTLAAHVASIVFNTADVGGPVTSRKIDKIAVTYQLGNATGEAELNSTPFGRMHKMLRDKLPATFSYGAPDRGWPLPKGRVL